MKTIVLKKNEDRRILDGHLWAFSNEIASIEGDPQTGDMVLVRAHGGKMVGSGFYNPRSLIAVRILTRHEEQIDFAFFRKRIEAALAIRRTLYPTSQVFRVVHGEADFLPGLIVEKYGDILTVQTLSAGMDRRLTLLCDVLESIFSPECIIERNESSLRSLEGLDQRTGVLRGVNAPLTITEYGLQYGLDLLEGQKTGFFLDQRENRRSIRRYAKGRTVLDCFCNDGGFALNAAYAEASEVTAVDSSPDAVARTSSNAQINKLDSRVHALTMDAFAFLKGAVDRGTEFGLVNLDPPSFARTKKAVTQAKRGYREIHHAAMQLLPQGGYLATSSCSHHILEETFLEIVSQCAKDQGRRISLLEWHGAAPDHPVLPAMPETRYLKFGIFALE